MTVDNTVAVPVAAEDAAVVKAQEETQPKAAKRQEAAERPAKKLAVQSANTKARKYSAEEKLEKLNLIEARITAGTSTLKDAVKSGDL